MDYGYLKEVAGSNPITVFTTFAVLVLGTIYFLLKNKGLPPGPVGLPYIGYWPFLKNEDIHLQLTELKKKYGDVYSFTVTGRLFIHLGSVKSMKEAHLTKSSCFSERYEDYGVLTMLFGKSVGTVNGEQWKILRKFFIQSFREYGLTAMKDCMAGPVYDSVNASVKILKNTKGSAINIIEVINDSSSDIVRRAFFDDDKITDEELKSLLEGFQKILVMFSGRNVFLLGEFARYFMFPRIENYYSSLENIKIMEECLEKIIRRHSEAFSKENVNCIIDSYINERSVRLEKKDPTAKYFTDEALNSSMIQLTGDGVLSVAVFIAYFIHELLEHPEEQDKIFKELEDVVGTDRQVTLEDRSKLPYTNAFIQEVMRTMAFLPAFPSLVCTEETTINGYRIPKGAISVMNTWSANRDPNLFVNPDDFNPSRYLNEPGKPKLETPVLFGIGKRSCAGESFTMMQVFLFLTAIVQNFRLLRPEGSVKTFFLDSVMEVCANPRK